jgi:hypothetical protein
MQMLNILLAKLLWSMFMNINRVLHESWITAKWVEFVKCLMYPTGWMLFPSCYFDTFLLREVRGILQKSAPSHKFSIQSSITHLTTSYTYKLPLPQQKVTARLQIKVPCSFHSRLTCKLHYQLYVPQTNTLSLSYL